MQQKLELLTYVHLSAIFKKLENLNIEINDFMQFFQELNVYNIRELNISKRTRNALYAYGIKHTNDLKKYSKKDLLAVKNIGAFGVRELEKEMFRLNLKMKES